MVFPKAEVLHLGYGCFTQNGRRDTPNKTSNINTEEWQHYDYQITAAEKIYVIYI